MKRVVLRLMLVCFCAVSVASGSAFAQDHDAVTDSVSIDDMAPVLYDEDAYEDEEEESSNGVLIGIVIAGAVLGGIVVAVKKKKK